MGGSTKVYDTTPSDIKRLRSKASSWLEGGGSQSPPMGGPRVQRPRMGMEGGLLDGPGGPQYNQPSTSGFDRIFAGPVNQPGRTTVDAPGDVGPMDRGIVRDVTGAVGPVQNIGPMSQASTDFMRSVNGVMPNINRSDIRTMGPIGIAPTAATDSVDKLGGANSAFFMNMMDQLRPAFDQRRTSALAAAKEAAGNLTGSGMGNSLGLAVNRSLGEEQATLADYATRGLQTEVGRQQGDAGRRSTEAIAQGNLDYQTGAKNVDSDIEFMRNMLTRGKYGLDASLAASELGQRGEFKNIDSALDVAKANQSTDLTRAVEAGRLGLEAGRVNSDNDFRVGSTNIDTLRGNRDARSAVAQLQAQLDQARKMGIFGAETDTANQNAMRFLQLLNSMSTAGVGPAEVVRTPGFGEQLLGAATQVGSAYLGGRKGK